MSKFEKVSSFGHQMPLAGELGPGPCTAEEGTRALYKGMP